MPLLLDISFSLPFTDPVLIFALILFIILFSPMLFKKLRMPGIIGLILAGVLIGPHGLNLLLRSNAIILFGTVGILYIMFLAGLEIDLNDFKKNRNRSIVFGALTFFIPIGIGTVVLFYFLEFNLKGAILLASMFSTHTLVAYPIVSRLGITRKEAVTITIGGTIITDTAVLLVLAVIAGATRGELDAAFWIRLIISLTIFGIVVLWGMPKISKWFFRNIEAEGVSQYIFVLAIVFLSAFFAELAGVEPIIGAFLAGLALNRLIPHTSALMNRIEFVGNALFIPFFLISVGMLVNFKVLFDGPEALIVTGSVIIITFGGKWLAAFITQKLYKYSAIERRLIFGLSCAHAAATLAVVLIGFDLGLFNENVLNATILLILITCMVSSFIVESAGRELAIIESKKSPDLSLVPSRILVPISNPATIERLIDFSLLVKDPNSEEPIFPLAVVKDEENTEAQLLSTNKMLEKAILHASATDHEVQLVSRIDMNTANGILRAARELLISNIIIGWNAKITTREMIFGSVLDNVLANSYQMLMVCKLMHPINTFTNVKVAVPPNAELEKGFGPWVNMLNNFARQIGANLVFYSNTTSRQRLEEVMVRFKSSVKVSYEHFDQWDRNFSGLSEKTSKDDLLFVISARSSTLSYKSYLDKIPKFLSKYYTDNSFVIVYPEQRTEAGEPTVLTV